MNKENASPLNCLDGTELGQLKARVFAYLNERYSVEPPSDLDALQVQVNGVFDIPEVSGMVKEWHSLAYG